MKKILFTGKGSYIGTCFKNYLYEQSADEYMVDELDVVGDGWENYDFSGYDVIYHVAAIVHMKEKKENEPLYYSVNRDLAYRIAEKAKKAHVKQFVFMSTMSVYGIICSDELISKNTPCNPKTFYGKSKLEAEKLIYSLNDSKFKVCILRPPMVYGKDSPGNMTKLIHFVKSVRIFPMIENERSSISINTLVEYVKKVIDNEEYGIFLPQNREYMCTYQIIRETMQDENIKVMYVKIFNPLIRHLIGKVSVISKCFGNLKYSRTDN